MLLVTTDFSMSEAASLRARAECFLVWATEARERGNRDSAEYLTALAEGCLDDAAALDAAGRAV